MTDDQKVELIIDGKVVGVLDTSDMVIPDKPQQEQRPEKQKRHDK